MINNDDDDDDTFDHLIRLTQVEERQWRAPSYSEYPKGPCSILLSMDESSGVSIMIMMMVMMVIVTVMMIPMYITMKMNMRCCMGFQCCY